MSDENKWGPNNPHPLSRMKTELVWEGKYDEYGNRRPVSLPEFPLVMQKIETIDEPRDAAAAKALSQGNLFDHDAFRKSSHRDDFRNRLIWGDNKLALAALLQEFRGQAKFIYIDPPFDVRADFTMPVLIGDRREDIFKEQSLIEMVAYRDTWGRGTDSYLAMMFERLAQLVSLLNADGVLAVHCDYRVSGFIRQILDELMPDSYMNTVVWAYGAGGNPKSFFPRKHDYIHIYGRNTEKHIDFSNPIMRVPYDQSTLDTHYKQRDNDGRRYRVQVVNGREYKTFADEGKVVTDVWTDVGAQNATSPISPESTGYNTQKPEKLLQRLIHAFSQETDLVIDCFSGSGTTLAVAEKLGRRWIGVDLGRFAVHTARKRLISAQRELNHRGEGYRSFDLYNLGRYERQWWQKDRLKGADEGHREAVLKFFRAQPLENPPSPMIHATKAGAYVHVDQIDSILTLAELTEVAKAVHATGAKKLICLAWEFEMDLRLRARALETELGLDIQLKYIPREIMEPNRNEIQFFDAAALEAEAFKQADGSIDIRLKTFLPSLTEVPERELEMLRERAVRSPFDFIDFWAVDFEHRDGKPFEHHWQDFRTRKDRSLKTESNANWKYEGKGPHQICVKVIDVFGIDTTTVVEVKV